MILACQLGCQHCDGHHLQEIIYKLARNRYTLCKYLMHTDIVDKIYADLGGAH